MPEEEPCVVLDGRENVFPRQYSMANPEPREQAASPFQEPTEPAFAGGPLRGAPLLGSSGSCGDVLLEPIRAAAKHSRGYPRGCSRVCPKRGPGKLENRWPRTAAVEAKI